MLKLIEIEKCDNYLETKEVYKKAFPLYERAPFFFLYRKRNRDGVKFYNIYDQDVFVGMVYLLVGQEMVYIWYFAIDENQRSNGYGGKALEKIKASYPNHTLSLASESVVEDANNYEQRQRRQAFYERHGFHESGYVMASSSTLSFDMLVYGGEFNVKVFGQLTEKFIGGALGKWLGGLKGRYVKRKS